MPNFAFGFTFTMSLCIRKNDGSPKIIVDLKEIIHTVVQDDNLALCLGGRYGTHLQYFQKFFKQLQELNAELIFFAVGNKLNYKLDLFISNQNGEYRTHLNLLDRIDANNGDVQTIRKHRTYNTRAPITMQTNMHKLARRFGELHINYVRHNQEIAKYIKQHDESVLAVITNDNDFMIFDGEFQFWQANDVNMRGLTGVRMCRKKLRARLDLDSKQLQLLSALSGSMYLPKTTLKSFYGRIRDENAGSNYIAHLGKYIRERVPRDNLFRFNLEEIGQFVFGGNYTTDKLSEIEKGLEQYDLNFDTIVATQRISNAMELAKTQNMFIYKLLTDDVHLIVDIAFIDFRNYRSKNYAELTVPLLQKLYGILYDNEFRRPREKGICMKYTHDESYKVQVEPIEYPPSKFTKNKYFHPKQ